MLILCSNSITIVRFPNNGKSVAATLQWRLSLEHELAMVAANQSRTTYRPATLTVQHVRQRLSQERQGARPRLCKPQTDPMENIGIATDTTVRFVQKCLQFEVQRQLLNRFKRSNREFTDRLCFCQSLQRVQNRIKSNGC